jgi:addiction module HigA family antidote
MSDNTTLNRRSIESVSLDNLDAFLADGQLEPTHPGILYKDLVVRREGLKIIDVANSANISREMLHRILRGEASITPKTAIGLGKVAGNEPSFWLRAQLIYDLWKEREKQKNAELAPSP